MFNISDYFKKFSKIEGDVNSQRDAILSAIYTVCAIDKPLFEVKKNILYIKGSSMVKSIIFTKKTQILLEINKSLPQSRITDIR